MAKAAWKEMDLPAVGSRWDCRFAVGAPGAAHTVKVMAVVDGYVMHRRPGASPSLTHMSNWHSRYMRKQLFSNRAALAKGDER